MSVVSQKTREDIDTVMSFFGIDRECNLHLFRAANDFNRDAFGTTFGALATAIRGDCRYGASQRIRAAIAEERAK